MIAPPTPEKAHLLNLYRQAAAICYLQQPDIPTFRIITPIHQTASPAVGGEDDDNYATWLRRDQPHIFFDVRRGERSIDGFSAVASYVMEKIKATSPQGGQDGRQPRVSFVETTRGSFQWNMQRVMTSDIYIATHGANMIHSALLPRGSIVIELVPPKFWCPAKPSELQPRNREDGGYVNASLAPFAHCWFTKFSWLLKENNHWLIPVAETSDKNSIAITPGEVWGLIRAALLAWGRTHGKDWNASTFS